MGLIQQAPATLLRKKTHLDELAFRHAILGARRIPRPLPVVHHRKLLGIVHGCSCCDKVYWTRDKKWLAPWTSNDDFITEIAASAPKIFTQMFSKAMTSSGTGAMWYDLWPVKGSPQAGSYGGTAYTAKQIDDTDTGAIAIGPDVSTDTRHLTHAWAVVNATSGSPPSFMLYDRVLTYENCSFNADAQQSMTNGVAAQRYISANEPGLLVSLTAETLLGATSSNLTEMTYTDNDGNSGQSMPTTLTVSIQPNAAAPTDALGARVVAPTDVGGGANHSLCLPLATGDFGVRSIASFTTSAANTGTLTFVLHRPLAIIPINTAGAPGDLDFMRQIMALNRVYDGAALALWAFLFDNNGFYMQGGFDVAWG